MKKIMVATSARGFLTELFDYEFENYSFYYESNKLYETNSKLKKILSKIIRSTLCDYLGVIQIINTKKKENKMDLIFSFNRFIKTKKPYIIYLENPLALVHYSTKRPTTFLAKRKLKRLLNDKNLKAIVCMSDACFNTLPQIYDLPQDLKVKRIYPFLKNVGNEKKVVKDDTNCTYISSDFYLKGGADILECHKLLKNKKNNLKFTIITKVDQIKDKDLKYINENLNTITLKEFNLNRVELNKIYKESHVLLNVSRQDSFPMVVYEALKNGNVIISTNLYAQTEMVDEGINGFQVDPKYRFFNKNNMPNEDVWNNREETIYSDYIDENIVGFLLEKLILLDSDKKLLYFMSQKSVEKSENTDFSSRNVSEMWEKLFSELEMK